MTHQESLAALLAVAGRVDDEARARAERHVAGCAQCWGVLRTVRALASDDAPAAAVNHDAFGCDAVEEQLFELVDLDAPTIRAQHPDVAHHLGWCLGCRALLAQLAIVETEALAGDYGAPIAAASQPAWRAAAARAGRRTRELVEAIVVSVRDGLVAIATVPAGVGAESLAPAGATRSADDRPSAGVRIHVPYPDARDGVDVTLSSTSDRRVNIEARGRFDAASLRVLRGAHDELIGVVPSGDGRNAQFHDVPAGPYVLGIVAEPAGELRIPITVVGAD